MSNILHRSLETLFRELIDGPAANAAWILNGEDVGLLRSLDTAPEARHAANRWSRLGGLRRDFARVPGCRSWSPDERPARPLRSWLAQALTWRESLAPSVGFEPTHPAPEASALSPELRGRGAQSRRPTIWGCPERLCWWSTTTP